MTRTFEETPTDFSGQVPLLIGLMGPSGGGKTYSAMRLATGIQRVSGGDIYVIDTEARRSLHYRKPRDRFEFRHIPFSPPFGSLDYLAAIEHCASSGAGVIVVDSMSHEHEGPGGVLEQHDAECDRLVKAWSKPGKPVYRDAVQMTAWGKPKGERRRMINSILQLPVSFIFCFRAKEKLKPVKGKQPEQQGFMPIAGEELVFEMTVNALLMPNAGGVPTWQSKEVGEQKMIKLPKQFHHLAEQRGPLDESAGEEMARWAAGVSNHAHSELVSAIDEAATVSDLEALVPRIKEAKAKRLITPSEHESIRDRYGMRQRDIKGDSSPSNDRAAADPDNGRQPGEDDE